MEIVRRRKIWLLGAMGVTLLLLGAESFAGLEDTVVHLAIQYGVSLLLMVIGLWLYPRWWNANRHSRNYQGAFDRMPPNSHRVWVDHQDVVLSTLQSLGQGVDEARRQEREALEGQALVVLGLARAKLIRAQGAANFYRRLFKKP